MGNSSSRQAQSLMPTSIRPKKKKVKFKTNYTPLTTREAAERLSHLISEIEKTGNEEVSGNFQLENKAERAEIVDPTELEKIKSDADVQKNAIDELYEGKRIPVRKETAIAISKRRRKSRLQILAYQEKAFKGIVAQAKERVARDASIGKRLDDILEDLFTQAACRMNEPHMVLFLRRQDFCLAKHVIAAGIYRCYQLTGEEFTAELNPKYPLEGEDIRVALSNSKGDIWVSNGLESRIELNANHVLVAMGTKRVFGLTERSGPNKQRAQ